MTVLSLKNKTSRYYFFFTSNYHKLILFQWKKPTKNVKKSNFHRPVLTDMWLDGKLHGNSRFCRVTMYFFTVLHLERHWKCPWKLRKCPWKSPWKVLDFFFWKPVLTMFILEFLYHCILNQGPSSFVYSCPTGEVVIALSRTLHCCLISSELMPWINIFLIEAEWCIYRWLSVKLQ